MQKILNQRFIPFKFLLTYSSMMASMLCLITTVCLANPTPSQNILDKSITVSLDQVTLKKVLNKISEVADCQFIYSKNLLPLTTVVSLKSENRKLKSILDEVLKPYNVVYESSGSYILIKEKAKSTGALLEKSIETISGRVIDSQTGSPMVGVNIGIKGTTQGTITDVDGRFTLNVPNGNAVLVVSFVGFVPEEITVGDQTTLSISLIPTIENLSQVVVIGYGTQASRDVTTSVASLKSEQINNFPATGLDKALTGKLAGVQVLQPSGGPGAGISIKVRGTGTITAGSSPLYVIDGVPLTDSGDDGPGFKVNALNAINVNDIESVDILKDASAAAIYGSRGANGVVMITTKRGRSNKPSISLNSYYGEQSTTKKIPMLDAYQYAQLIYDAHNNTYFDLLADKNLTGSATDDNATRLSKLGASATNTSLSYLLPPEITPYLRNEPGLTNTDWQDEILKKAPMQSHTLSVRGGSDNIKYYISGNYLDQQGIVINSGYKKYGGRVNLDAKYKRLKVGTSINYTIGLYDYLPTEGRFNDNSENVISGALAAAPFFPVYNADGSYNYGQYKWQYSQSNAANPVALARLKKDKTYEHRLLSNVFAEYDVWKDIRYKISLGTTVSNFDRSTFRPSTLPNSLTRLTPSIPTATYITSQTTNWVLENTLSYNKNIGAHSLNAIGGFTTQKERRGTSNIGATGFPDDIVQTLNGATTVTSFASAINEWSLLSGLGRLQYGFQDKYLLSAALRVDGSSRFGPKNKWGYFPSTSAGWIVSEEAFLKNSTVISSLKVRASYGVTGNFQIGNYAYLALLSSSSYVLGSGANPSLSTGLYQSTPGNGKLGWEKTSAVNVGTDISLFDEQLNVTLDVYTNNTNKLLLNVPVPLSSGYSTDLVNIGKVNNKGIEVTISSATTLGKFKLSNSLNYSLNRNKVLDLGGISSIITQAQNTIYFITEVGKPIGNYYTLVKTGVYKDQAEIDASTAKVPGAKPGDFKYQDIDGNKMIDGNDKAITGNYMPKFTYGFSSQLQYGLLDLSIALQGLYGNKIANINQRHMNSTESYANNTTDALERWQSPSQPGNGVIARANRSQRGLNAQISTYHLSDGSYLRIRDITLGVTAPDSFTKKIGIEKVRIYTTGQNLFTFTKYNSFNPEVSNDSNPLTPGIDYGSYPLAKTWLFGINLTF